MRYYEGHETVYRRLRDKGCRSWDEYVGQSADFDSFSMKRFVEEILGCWKPDGSRPLALEIGCGTGPVCCFLAENGFAVEGIDVSATAIAMAREYATGRGFSIDYRVADVCTDVLPRQRYDLVIDGHCLHCIVTEEERLAALENVRGALRLGGQFWLDTMLADDTTDFGGDMVLDDEGILWVKTPTPGGFDLERRIGGETYVANRRVYRDPERLETELQASGFTIAWSNVAAPGREGEPASYRAVCTVEDQKAEMHAVSS